LGKFTIGRVAGIPLVIDGSILLLAVLWIMPYARDGTMLAIGGLILVGVLFTVLMHELGHAFAGRLFGVDSTHIELNGLGGLCFYESLPRNRLQRVVMSLAGPAVTFIMWRFCVSMEHLLDDGFFGTDSVGLERLSFVLWQIGEVNYFMLLFNLLPSFPLDGGTALKELIATRLNPYRANWIVGALGMLVAIGCVIASVRLGQWMLLMAAMLFISNWQILSNESRPPWQRLN
jgi:Zn-dependent protease